MVKVTHLSMMRRLRCTRKAKEEAPAVREAPSGSSYNSLLLMAFTRILQQAKSQSLSFPHSNYRNCLNKLFRAPTTTEYKTQGRGRLIITEEGKESVILFYRLPLYLHLNLPENTFPRIILKVLSRLNMPPWPGKLSEKKGTHTKQSSGVYYVDDPR